MSNTLIDGIVTAIVVEVAEYHCIPTAVIYVNSGGADPENMESLCDQEDVCFEYCAMRNIIMLDEFSEYEHGEHTQGLWSAVEFCERTNVDYLVVKDLSRISKSGAEIRNIYMKLREHGTTIIPVQGGTRVLDALELSPLNREDEKARDNKESETTEVIAENMGTFTKTKSPPGGEQNPGVIKDQA